MENLKLQSDNPDNYQEKDCKEKHDSKDKNSTVVIADNLNLKEEFSNDSQEKLEKENFLYSKLKEIFREYLLSEIQSIAAFKFIKEKFLNNSNDAENVKKWVIMKINNKRFPEGVHKMQMGCPDLVPGLSIKNFWDPFQFQWLKELVKNVNVIREELIVLRTEKGFQPYKSPSYASDIKSKDNMGSLAHDKGEWNVFYLFLHEIKFEENCSKCPRTVDLIKNLVPRQYLHAFFSAVAPVTHIISHNGPTNRKLRLHLPLLNVEGSRIRVGDDIKYFEENVPVIFDDSFNHESWHDGNKTRINLILDFWHPDLTDAEVKFFKVLQQAKLKNGKKYLEMLGQGAEDDNYFDIIEKSKEILKNNDWWVG